MLKHISEQINIVTKLIFFLPTEDPYIIFFHAFFEFKIIVSNWREKGISGELGVIRL